MVVVGVGLNVSTTADELPVATATSLALAGAGDVDRSALLVDVLRSLAARYAQWTVSRGDARACGLADTYRAACTTLGRVVQVRLAGGEMIEGTAVDVDDLGRLLIRTGAGLRPVGAGDVEHVRPA
jgi:BirA family biotin operon repressor/biotin-[acetyl-CoA-carboxylase] ligase